MTKTIGESFRETDIRPDALMTRARGLLELDTRRLIADKAEFVEVDCPACGGTSRIHHWSKRGLDFVRCLDCRTAYGSPRPTPERLARYYAEATYYDYWNRYIYPQSEAARRASIFRPRVQRLVELVRRHHVSPGILVEVGAGSGMFCQELNDLGLFERVLAVEPTTASAAACRARGVEVLETVIEKADLSQVRVDVLAAFEVLEHLFDPLAFVKACREQLADGGLLVLTCPNGLGFDVAILGEVADTVTPEHLNYFNPHSLALLMRRGGLELLEVFTPGKLDAEIVRKKVLAGQFDLTGQPFLQRVLCDEWDRLGEPFQRFLANNGLSSHQWLVARRPDTSREESE